MIETGRPPKGGIHFLCIETGQIRSRVLAKKKWEILLVMLVAAISSSDISNDPRIRTDPTGVRREKKNIIKIHDPIHHRETLNSSLSV